ncbi:NUDIX domain-containing protein [Frigoribacterium sp. PhB24]|uniref:NUDIX domain-containing protein n=1 Tax=Frigoribacterium sp. PhB24 TaxID=2485204 RepID=UPI000F8FD112|nr:NUDIX domain-containing protein [Frigoribacterium sp. PhB24]ROS54209.1 ADP-ribose pyrophosphatase YjhB (NUDIX family) [Frigoribacterium sp. PhB24]
MNTHEPADGWVEAPDGRRFWGRAGAAGLLVVDPDDRVLLQHRADWSHFGGTWGLPGGARHHDESAVEGALRESGEEAAVPGDALRLLFASELDLGFWSYTTVVARAVRPFEPVVSDAESIALSWVPADEVADLPLHPGFAASWPRLRVEMGADVHVVVDVANVLGSRPDGWWRDRAGATNRFLDAVSRGVGHGVAESLVVSGGDRGRAAVASRRSAADASTADSGAFADASTAEPPGAPTWRWPGMTVVVEGDARAVGDTFPGLTVVRAEADGDSAIVARVRELRAVSGSASRVVVVTADRALADRAVAAGATVVGPGVFRRAVGLDPHG